MSVDVVSGTQLSLDSIFVDPQVLPGEERQDGTNSEGEYIPSLQELNPIEALPKASLAPMLQQYQDLKKQYPEYILLFQVGDFYEIFFEDAKIAAHTLGIRLTSRHKEQPNPVAMCGVPIHALENYLPKLVENGFRCVIVSQVEEEKNKKGMVRREISRIITPGVRYEGDGLEQEKFNYLAAACLGPRADGGISYVDVSTGHLKVQNVEHLEELLEAIALIRPSELIVPSTLDGVSLEGSQAWVREVKKTAREIHCQIVLRPFERQPFFSIRSRLFGFFPEEVQERNSKKFSQHLENLLDESATAMHAVLSYIEEVSFGRPPKLAELSVEERSSLVFIDAATRQNLELLKSRSDGDKKNSFLHHVNYTKTAMGSRLLTEWFLSPSCNLHEIEKRQSSVEELTKKQEALDVLRTLFAQVRDLDRLVSRITSSRLAPRDLGILKDSIAVLPQVFDLLEKMGSSFLQTIHQELDPLADIYEKLQEALAEELPTKVNEGDIFQDGYHEELDRLRHLTRNGRTSLTELEQKERLRTGISGLKVKYNNVFGYFIEITKTHLSKIPADYQRKQTLVNAERFVTEELKSLELSLLSAKARQIDLERELFVQLKIWLNSHIHRIQQSSHCLSVLDVLCALAHLACEHGYCRPVMAENCQTIIRNGRHPVVEQVLGHHNFVRNDALLNTSNRRLAILTGPNMGGKSTYLRQVGLIHLMAQAGSFVPAESAELGIVDRIFTRIGAADDLLRGDSTFMVEMREATGIVRKATSHSLVLIDEIGRGTATTDGLAIATAIAEWLHDTVRCRTIYATHFHELTSFAQSKEGAFCLAVGVTEQERDITFTHKIEERAADRSYGIEVARLAGLPEALISRAEEILEALEKSKDMKDGKTVFLPTRRQTVQHINTVDPCQQIAAELIDRLRSYRTDSMTPLDALVALNKLQQLIAQVPSTLESDCLRGNS